MKIYMKLSERRETSHNGEPWVKFTFVPISNQMLPTTRRLVGNNPSKVIIHLPFDEAQNGDLGKLLVGNAVQVDLASK